MKGAREMAVHDAGARLVEQFGPTEAQAILKKNNLAYQRKLSHKHVQHLQELIEASTNGGTKIRTFIIGLAYVRIKGDPKCLQVNGQHSCNAIIRADTTVRALIEEWQCDSIHDLGDAYTIYDTDEKPRNLDQLILLQRDSLELNWSHVATLLTVKASWDLNQRTTDMKKSDKISMIKNLINEGEFLNSIYVGNDKKHITRKPIASMMLLCWYKNQDEAYNFWENVRDGAKLEIGDSRKLLRDWLFKFTWRQGRPFIGQNQIDIREIKYKISYAWNKYMGNESIQRLRYSRLLPIPDLLSTKI
jgi:hypothetical protein